MKILMLCDSMERGGAETHVFTLACALTKRGHRVDIVSGGGALAEEAEMRGARHLTLPLKKRSPFLIAFCALAIARIIKKGHYDVVHTHSRFTSFLAHKTALKRGSAFVSTAHAKFSLHGFRKRLSVWSNNSIAVSQDLKQYLVCEYRVPAENITVIPNGVDLDTFYPICDTEAKRRIIFLSRMDHDCALGARLLCRIAPRLCRMYKKTEILLGGGGSALEEIRREADAANKKIGYEALHCVGEVSDCASFFRKGDIFVGVSRAAIEAALCGLSVILCGDEGFMGALTPLNFYTALAVNFCARDCPQATQELLFSALCDLCAEPLQSRTERAHELRNMIASVCSAEKMCDATESCYRRAVAIPRKESGTLLCGYYGFGNMGDDLLLRASIDRCKREFAEDGIRALTKNGKRDSGHFGIICKKRSSPLSVIKEIKKCRRLVFGGGTLLQASTSLRSMIYYTLLLFLGRLFKKDCLLWGNGIGKCEGRAFAFLCKLALRCCTFAEMRDTRSFALANYFSGNRVLPKTVLAKDLALTRRRLYSDAARAEYLLRELLGPDHAPFIVAIPKADPRKKDLIDFIKQLAVDHSRGCKILLVPMCEREDMKICEDIASCKHLEAKILHGACFDDLAEICRLAQAVYSMRLHGLIAADVGGCSCKAFGDDVKLRSFESSSTVRQKLSDIDIPI